MKRLNQRGAVAALVAILLVLIMVCVSFVVDLGHIHNVKVLLQAAVDSGALAGAEQLPSSLPDTEVKPYSVAAFNKNMEGSAEPTTITIGNVEVGHWDKDALGQPASVRFEADPEDDPINAVKVTASLDVTHFFFWFIPSTTVTVDAIAVNIFEKQTIPIALVSCIPTGGSVINISSPGLNVCDITTYHFHPSPSQPTDDTAAWTSLTFNPASNQNIQAFLDENGVEVFNQVIYGTGLAHDGIENTTVATTNKTLPVPDFPVYDDVLRGCIGNNGIDIVCGLGPDPSVDVTSFLGIRQFDQGALASGVSVQNVVDDPLAYNPLPRWYHFGGDGNPPPSTGPYDPWNNAFIRLVTQDGLLLGSQTELQALYEGTNDPFGPSVYNSVDYRFVHDGNKEKFIDHQSGGGPGGTYKPKYNEVLKYAGYPPVWVNNGEVQAALTEFLDGLINPLPPGPGDGTLKTSLAELNPPFDTDSSGAVGLTIRLTLPVIFAGACDEWKAISSGPATTTNTLYYIGTASFLITRAWQNPKCYSFLDPDVLTVAPSATVPCAPINNNDYAPSISGGQFVCTGGSAPNGAIEGLWLPPVQGEHTETGVVKIYLVE